MVEEVADIPAAFGAFFLPADKSGPVGGGGKS